MASEIELDNFRFEIIDRWGVRIWGTQDINQGWNGAPEGNDYFCSPGAYAYFIRYENSVPGKIVETTGHVVLIR